jgi:hypothetical protein
MISCRLFFASVLIATATVLSGCATPITAKVTNFNAWPADAAGSSFSFASLEPKASDLEQATYENYVGVELQRRGLQLAPPGQKGRFLVDVSTTGTTREKKFLQPIYNNQLIYVAPYRSHGYGYGVPYGFNGAYGSVLGGYYVPDQFGSRYIGDQEVTRTVQVSRLKVRLFDSTSSTPRPRAVFESTAVYEGEIEDLPDTVPYLVTAVFDDFPGQNGRVKLVKFDTAGAAIRH